MIEMNREILVEKYGEENLINLNKIVMVRLVS